MSQTPTGPIFILGTTRSGTSALQLAILEGTRYVGNGEGHLITILAPLLEAGHDFLSNNPAATLRGTTAFETSARDITNALYVAVRSLFEKRFGEAPFCDKTPNVDAIRLAPHFAKIWPGTRIIWCQRRGIENVASKRRKFPAETFATHCREWAGCMSAWRQVRPLLDSYIEIDQRDLDDDAADAAERVGDYVGWNTEEVSSVTQYLETRRPESSRASRGVMSLDATGWDESGKATFVEICGGTMADFGYAMDDRYWLDSPED